MLGWLFHWYARQVYLPEHANEKASAAKRCEGVCVRPSQEYQDHEVTLRGKLHKQADLFQIFQIIQVFRSASLLFCSNQVIFVNGSDFQIFIIKKNRSFVDFREFKPFDANHQVYRNRWNTKRKHIPNRMMKKIFFCHVKNWHGAFLKSLLYSKKNPLSSPPKCPCLLLSMSIREVLRSILRREYT